jgi:hypothetical protein
MRKPAEWITIDVARSFNSSQPSFVILHCFLKTQPRPHFALLPVTDGMMTAFVALVGEEASRALLGGWT